MLGIIGAMEEEVVEIKKRMKDIVIFEKAKMQFYKGNIDNTNVVVVRAGIGKVNAAICTQILIDQFNVNAVINTGIAGSLRNEINIGDIVVSTDALQHDMDAVAFGYPKGQIPRMDTLSFKADEELCELAIECCKRVNKDIGVYKGRVLSGDMFVSDSVKKEELVNEFNGFCTEMEGAAIAQTAYLNNVKYVIIRAISDKADDSANMDYPEFEAGAIEHCVNLTLNMISYL